MQDSVENAINWIACWWNHRFMTTMESFFQSFLTHSWQQQPHQKNVQLPLPFFVLIKKIVFNRHRTLNPLVGVDQVLDTSVSRREKKKMCWERNETPSQHFFLFFIFSPLFNLLLFFRFISRFKLFEKKKQVLSSS